MHSQEKGAIDPKNKKLTVEMFVPEYNWSGFHWYQQANLSMNKV
jgi:hypothetical protein